MHLSSSLISVRWGQWEVFGQQQSGQSTSSLSLPLPWVINFLARSPPALVLLPLSHIITTSSITTCLLLTLPTSATTSRFAGNGCKVLHVLLKCHNMACHHSVAWSPVSTHQVVSSWAACGLLSLQPPLLLRVAVGEWGGWRKGLAVQVRSFVTVLSGNGRLRVLPCGPTDTHGSISLWIFPVQDSGVGSLRQQEGRRHSILNMTVFKFGSLEDRVPLFKEKSLQDVWWLRSGWWLSPLSPSTVMVRTRNSPYIEAGVNNAEGSRGWGSLSCFWIGWGKIKCFGIRKIAQHFWQIT